MLLLPILGFGYPAIQDVHFCQVVGPYIRSMAKIWNLFVEVNNTKDPAEKDQKSRESYEALWQLILRILKSELTTKNIPEEPFRNHFYDCLRETHQFYQNQAANSRKIRAEEMVRRDEKFKGKRMSTHIHRLRGKEKER